MRRILVVLVFALACAESSAFAQGPLTNGDTHAGTIAIAGQIDVWTFSAAQGDFIALSIGEVVAVPDPGFVPLIQLKNHDTGTVITSASGSLAAQIAVNAPLTANYDVLVRDSNISRPGTALGSYLLTLVKTPGALTIHAGDEGGAMTNGANHAGALFIGDLDAWTFTAAKDDYLALSIGEVLDSEIDPQFVPWIRLIGPTGNLVTSAAGALAAQVGVAAPLSGTYTVLVSDSAISREPSHIGNYRLTLFRTPSTFSVPVDDQGGALTDGANHPGDVYVGDLDAWTFTAAKDDYVVLSIGEVLESEIDPQFVPWIRLIGPTGALVTQAAGALAAQITVNVPLSGTYTLLVSDSAISREPSHTGTYLLRYIRTAAVPTIPDGDEGGPMTPGANHAGVITVGDVDPWTFTAAQGDYISLKIGEVVLSEIDPNFVPWIRLIGPTGVQVAMDTGALSGALAVNAPLSGTYTVIVSDSGISREPSHEGSYLLTLAKIPGPFIVPTGDEGGTLRDNVERAGVIHSGDLDEWTFSATIGHALTVNISEVIVGTDPGFVPWIRLIGPTGALVSQAAGALTASINVAAAPLTGTYTVIVSDSDISREGSATGNYLLKAIGVDPSICDAAATPGVTPIRALDISDLRSRVNNVRTRFGLGSFAFTDTNLTGVLVKATHIVELRTALQQAYVAAGRTVPTYTDPTLVAQQSLIKAVHVNELCAAVVAAEQ